MPVVKNKEAIIVVSAHPYFSQKGRFWFEKNYERILRARNKFVFWKENVLILEKNLHLNPLALLRRLDELGYEKMHFVRSSGQFAIRGGTLDIFAINHGKPIRIEFEGNKISEIYKIDFQEIKTLGEKPEFKDLNNLKPDEYVVHLDHGVGIFKKFIKIEDSDYFAIEYAKNERLYVPIAKQEKLSRYIGFKKPPVYTLGGNLWVKIKKRVEKETIEFAKELLALYARRETSEGFSCIGDEALEREFDDLFEFEETHDQSFAILQVKKDLENEKSMDRLVCGDSGFGKTEVALRAAFKIVISGHQVAMLCPTTILCKQHEQTFKERFKKFPIEIASLSRLNSSKETKEILEKLKKGQVDIIIGTHRLFSGDIKFRDLRLLIIDEEQKFGVKQKEKFKELRENLNVLSLSATPIPRSLYLALAGLRDMSIISTAPTGRIPVSTFISIYKSKVVKKALLKELERKGQVFWLHNKIPTINFAAEKIRKLVPQARIAVAHGQMQELELVDIMNRFQNKEIDVLVATTIIENGLDFPNVNTLIISDATRLGLSQAYQLRGRVGRGERESFAYFFYRSKNLNEKTKKRLKALKLLNQPGSGYQIAVQDLEIRGSGNILGKEQSGNISAVGLNLYMEMLNRAVEQLNSKVKNQNAK